MVEQFGLAMMPPLPAFMPAIASGFTSGTTRGTPSVMRNADELSTTVAPAAAATGAKSRDTSPPAEKSAMSTPAKLEAVSAGATGSWASVRRLLGTAPALAQLLDGVLHALKRLLPAGRPAGGPGEAAVSAGGRQEQPPGPSPARLPLPSSVSLPYGKLRAEMTCSRRGCA